VISWGAQGGTGGAFAPPACMLKKALVKSVLAVLPTGYGKSLIFTLFLLARENITRINTDRRRVFIATAGLTGLLRLGLLAASRSELFKTFFNTRLC
jgi:hypothetical protein